MSEIITVYHGSPKVITKPKYGYGNAKNDYGLGFYLTEDINLAKEWACSESHSGYANKYELDMTDLSVLSLTNGEYNILNWLAVLLENRVFLTNAFATEAKKYILDNFGIEYKSYDVIRGYRADDSYFAFANAFLNNTLSLKQLEKAMFLGKLGEQIVLVSKKAFESINFINAEPAPKEIYLNKKVTRDSGARESFRKEKSRGIVLSEKYVLDIMRERWTNDNECLQRIILR